MHTTCINGWFKSHGEGNADLKYCPYCRTKMQWCDLKRVFPVLSEKNIKKFFDKSDAPSNGKKYRPASSSCTLCDEYTLEYHETLKAEEGTNSFQVLRPIVAARCGHYFHTTCLLSWFIGNHVQHASLKPCPNTTCGRKMHSHDIKRIFPVSSDED